MDKKANFDTGIANFTPRQMDAVRAYDSGLYKYILYGGAMGGGKSYFLRWFAVRFLMQVFATYGLTWVQTMLACEDYPSLKDRQIVKMEREFPRWLGTHYTDHKAYGRSFILSPRYGNGVICLRNLDDPSKYASSEFALIEVDELTKNLIIVFNDLRTRLRWPGLTDMQCPFIGGTNPGSVGHGWVKSYWMTHSFPEEFYPPISEVDYRPTFKYIPSKAEDNPHLDPSYWTMLSTLPKALRKAFREGDWNTFVGQAFQEWDSVVHVIHPIPVPSSAPIYFTMDWGFGAPFSLGWWWVDNDGRLYRFHEKYGWTGEANKGLRLSDDTLAEVIKAEEKVEEIDPGRIVRRLAGPDCFAKRADVKGGGQGPATAETFKKHGITLYPGDPKRVLKIRQMHNRLAIPEDHSRPMLLVYDTCEQFIRTIADLVVDPGNIEDVDTRGEDHPYDEASHICMFRPISDRGSAEAGKKKRMERPLSRKMTISDVAALEIQAMRDEIEQEAQMEAWR